MALKEVPNDLKTATGIRILAPNGTPTATVTKTGIQTETGTRKTALIEIRTATGTKTETKTATAIGIKISRTATAIRKTALIGIQTATETRTETKTATDGQPTDQPREMLAVNLLKKQTGHQLRLNRMELTTADKLKIDLLKRGINSGTTETTSADNCWSNKITHLCNMMSPSSAPDLAAT